MRTSTLEKRHYALATALLLGVTLLGLLYMRLVAEQWLPDVRPWLLGQDVFQEDQVLPDSPGGYDQLPAPMPIMNASIAAGQNSELADARSEDRRLAQFSAVDPSVAPTEPEAEPRSDAESRSQPVLKPEQENASLEQVGGSDAERELVSTPGTQSEGRQLPRLDLDLPLSELEGLVQSGHLLLIVRALDQRSRSRFLRAEPVDHGFRLQPLSDSELGKVSSRHIGYGRNGLSRKVLADTSRTLRSMNLDKAELTLRFTAEADLQLQRRQLDALAEAGMTAALESGEVVSTRGRLVDCGGVLTLEVAQVSSGSQTVVFDDPRTRC